MKLSQRERRMILGGAIAVALLIAYPFALKPGTDKWRSTRTILTQRETALGSMRESIDNRAELASRLASLRTDLGGGSREVSRADKKTELVGILQNIAGSSGVNITRFTEGKTSDGSGYKRVKVTITFDCNASALPKFIYEIDKGPHMLNIDKFDVKNDTKKPGSISASMNLSAFFAS